MLRNIDTLNADARGTKRDFRRPFPGRIRNGRRLNGVGRVSSLLDPGFFFHNCACGARCCRCLSHEPLPPPQRFYQFSRSGFRDAPAFRFDCQHIPSTPPTDRPISACPTHHPRLQCPQRSLLVLCQDRSQGQGCLFGKSKRL